MDTPDKDRPNDVTIALRTPTTRRTLLKGLGAAAVGGLGFLAIGTAVSADDDDGRRRWRRRRVVARRRRRAAIRRRRRGGGGDDDRGDD